MKTSGQTLLEFLLFLPLLLTTLGGGAWLLKQQWNRNRCAFQVFQAVHTALRTDQASIVPRAVRFMGKVKINTTPDGLEGSAQCGQAREQIKLPWLESAQW